MIKKQQFTGNPNKINNQQNKHHNYKIVIILNIIFYHSVPTMNILKSTCHEGWSHKSSIVAQLVMNTMVRVRWHIVTQEINIHAQTQNDALSEFS